MTAKTETKATKVAKETTNEVTSKVTEGAREFVKRSAETAQERAESVYNTTKNYNSQLENTLKRAATGYANILGGIAEAAFANVNHTLAAVEKLAEAKSLNEAAKIQSEYVREHTAQNMEHVRAAYDYVRDVASENMTSVREGYAKMWPSSDKKAA
ncbi:phasin family protein [Marimonas sp. MJW-29]|uniref:Phasin family protein n=1 Tax=Sulfitobacter sediminis TaxID=3234186 RepID=A0ABV3RJT1_9RHOB